MRITNKVMQNNALSNINNNKVLQDNLTTQLSTGKKIYKPSEDPVTAIRALRLRNDVSHVNQYYEKNVPDAQSWIELTESAVSTTVSVVKNMIEKCEKGANDSLTTSDRQVIIDSLIQLADEAYSTGNADFAGRYIFTGYRTDTALSFGENTTKKYGINEIVKADMAEQKAYIDVSGAANLLDISESSFDGAYKLAETDISSVDYSRVRLSYGNIDSDTTVSVDLLDEKFASLGQNVTVSVVADKEQAYNSISSAAGMTAILVPGTGELLLSSDLMEYTKANNAQISVSYEKSEWTSKDLRPEHYFYCTTENEEGNEIEYNPEYTTTGSVGKDIEYQVGYSQYITVNTNAEDVYKHGISREANELKDLANYLEKVETVRDKLKAMSKNDSYSDDEKETINGELDAANKAVTLLKDQLQKRFSSAITQMQGYLSSTNDAVTLIGNRASRLDLIENRLESQQTTFKTLQSENEDADATEVAVRLSSAEVSYQAALMATSDMIKETLLNYL